MKTILTLLFAFCMTAVNAQYIGIAIDPAKVTVNPDYSFTITQELPSNIPAVSFFRFGWVAGQGQWVTLANVSPSSVVNNVVTYTTSPCILTDSIQFAAGCSVFFVDPQYVQGTGYSTTFVRQPCITFQGTGGCCGNPTGTPCPYDGSCGPLPTPNPNKKKKK